MSDADPGEHQCAGSHQPIFTDDHRVICPACGEMVYTRLISNLWCFVGHLPHDQGEPIAEPVGDLDAIDAIIRRCAMASPAALDGGRHQAMMVLENFLADVHYLINQLNEARDQIARLQAAVRLVYPDDMTPSGKRVFDSIFERAHQERTT